ncbi:hypothetical protein [Nonomuraea sp. SBT364]|uniref:hypothetical protein n=1 Tax=Nonomuraea sp. SBT364 TaxID=1580530 RepID=UPI00066D3CA7|nr:hypothetical protein [Nonomuraea sp. SBT364]
MVLVLAPLLTLAACAADSAVQDARDKADQIADRLMGYDPWVPDDVGHHLTRQGEYVTVLDVSDGRRRVQIEVRGERRADGPPAEAVLCFDLELIQDWRVDVTEIGCPGNVPLLG